MSYTCKLHRMSIKKQKITVFMLLHENLLDKTTYNNIANILHVIQFDNVCLTFLLLLLF